MRIALNFSPQKAGAAAGQPAAGATAKGARADVDCAILRVVAAAATPPLILLLGRAPECNEITGKTRPVALKGNGPARSRASSKLTAWFADAEVVSRV
jgi:hypothetical protein